MCSDGSDIYHEAYEWTPVAPLYGEQSNLKLDRNGMTKLMRQFVEALGPDAVRVALDEALEKAGTETE